MFEIIAGIIAGLMVQHWTSLFVFPCFIGLINAVWLAIRMGNRQAKFTPSQVAQMKDEGMTDKGIRETEETLTALNQPPFSRWVACPLQFVWSSLTAFPFCLVVGGIKLLFFE